MRDTFSFVCRAAPSLVWTISITTVLKFNDSEPNELHLDKFAFVGFVPRNTVNLTREPRVMNYGEYEFARPFFDFASFLYLSPPLSTAFSKDSADPESENWFLSIPVTHLDGFSRDGTVVVRQERKKTLSRDP